MKVFKPPVLPKGIERNAPKIFIGGSIEQGKAIDWQKAVEMALVHYKGALFNPRRENWDPTWEQKASNPQFAGQVNWEMDQIGNSDLVIFFLQAGTLSPISIGEIYWMAATRPDRMIVACEPDFWRRGNIEVMSQREGFILVSSLKELIEELVKVLNAEYPEIQTDSQS
jgi:hypothetical protein